MSGRVDFKEAGAELKFVSRPDLGFVAESRSRYIFYFPLPLQIKNTRTDNRKQM